MKTARRQLFTFIAGVLLFTGIPLLSWGIFETSAYFSNPYRTLYTILMVISTLLVVLFVPEQGRGSGEGVKLLARQKLAIRYLQVAFLLFVILSPISDRYGLLVFPDESFARPTGLLLTTSGYFLMNWAILALGKQFSIDVTIQKDHKLITNGPYRLIRHPRYLGIIFFLSGISLVFRSALSLILIVPTVLIMIWRIYDEEKLMLDEFPDEWKEYTKRTRRLIPFLY